MLSREHGLLIGVLTIKVVYFHSKEIKAGAKYSLDLVEKIRTYNYPQNRVTDHRIGLTLHKLEAIVEGDLEELLSALRQHHQAALLEAQKDRS